jgi:Tfp pilus assembly protein PilN
LPNESYDEGYGWGGKVAWTDNPELAKIQQGVMQAYKEQQQTSKDTTKIEQNTKDMANGLGTVSGGVQGGVLGALVAL